MRPASFTRRPTDLEAEIAKLAGRQHGVVSRAQLIGLGMGSAAIKRRIAAGRLHRIHTGVFLVGHTAPARWADEMAALLACGPQAVISHRSAASMWGLTARRRMVELTVPPERTSERARIVVHRSRLRADEIRRLEGVPLTSPLRTITDLAAVAPKPELERMVAEAHARGLVRTEQLLGEVDAAAGRRGIAKLRAVLGAAGGPAFTRSEAERRMLRLLRSSSLPLPQVNTRLGPYEVDFLWREPRLVVEVDGATYHSDPVSFERDRLRDAELQAAGYRVMRVTWRQLVDAPEAVLARLRRALNAAE